MSEEIFWGKYAKVARAFWSTYKKVLRNRLGIGTTRRGSGNIWGDFACGGVCTIIHMPLSSLRVPPSNGDKGGERQTSIRAPQGFMSLYVSCLPLPTRALRLRRSSGRRHCCCCCCWSQRPLLSLLPSFKLVYLVWPWNKIKKRTNSLPVCMCVYVCVCVSV